MTSEHKGESDKQKEHQIDWGGGISHSTEVPDFDRSPLDQIRSWLEGAFAFMGAERIQAMMNKLQEMRQVEKPPEDKP